MSISKFFKDSVGDHSVDYASMSVLPKLGPYATIAALSVAHSPESTLVGRAAIVGASAPYATYINNGITAWVQTPTQLN